MGGPGSGRKKGSGSGKTKIKYISRGRDIVVVSPVKKGFKGIQRGERRRSM